MSVLVIHAISGVVCGENWLLRIKLGCKVCPKSDPQQFIVIIHAYNIRGSKYSVASILMC